jgi:hypothetical protein
LLRRLCCLWQTPITSGSNSVFDADSPFSGELLSYFHLEDFEDHLLDTPGVTGAPASPASGVTSVVFGPSIHDSVDGDDGSIDGSGLDGDSYFAINAAAGGTFTFDAGVLGSLPDHAGIVWTDGAGAVTFKAFGPGHVSLGTLGPDGSFVDGSVVGTTWGRPLLRDYRSRRGRVHSHQQL